MAKRAKKESRLRAQMRVPKSVREVMGFNAMSRDGIAYLGDNRYSASLVFTDVNYSASSEAHQLELVERWAKVLNSFDSTMRVQIGLYTQTQGAQGSLGESLMELQADGFDAYRQDYNRQLARKVEILSAHTNVVKTLTVSVQRANEQEAKNALNTIMLSVSKLLNSIDKCKAVRMTRVERLKLIASITRPEAAFTFSEEAFAGEKQRDTRDFTLPYAISKDTPSMVKLESDDKAFYHKTLWISDFPPMLSDGLIRKLISLHENVNVSIHLEPIDRASSMDMVRSKSAELNMQKQEIRKRNIKQMIDPDEMPDSLAEQLDQVESMRDELSSSNQKLMKTLIIVGVHAASVEELDHITDQIRSTVHAEACSVESLAYMQIEGLNAELPLGANTLPLYRTLMTDSAAILIPFVAVDIYEPQGIFYGVNADTGNPIMADRRESMNSNGFVLGTSGGGKSFTVKQELTGLFLNRRDDVLIIDPEREYAPLVDAFHGQRIELSASTQTCINPLDIVFDDSLGDPIKDKVSNVTAMLSTLIGGSYGLNPVQKSILDTTLVRMYQDYRLSGLYPGQQPTLATLRALLMESGEEDARQIATALAQYTEGSLSAFNGQTNVSLANRLTVFDVSSLSGELRMFGMMTLINQIWNRVLANRDTGKRTWLYIDEFHRFFTNEYTAQAFLDLYKRARKYGLGVTGITQNIEDLLENADARKMLSNSDFLMLLSQTSTDADALCDLLKLSDDQRRAFTTVLPGQGLMKFAEDYVPFDGRIEADGLLYELFDTKFDDTTTTAA
ncbi:transfer complex protein [Alloscardovia macacae]|uniref:Transfer complex protein n=1 Tax=Alloscardovia macacae TaxID=1160091 RepID=A0A1Y2T3A2_9BIFI|nr:DUF87 domain-containing protein [Alloscardovia macacae]OTA26445.1 transfer complex protein [Alloscardovia macacae]OTA29875.1 transfer complex protein [Alloscardovia macacae]